MILKDCGDCQQTKSTQSFGPCNPCSCDCHKPTAMNETTREDRAAEFVRSRQRSACGEDAQPLLRVEVWVAEFADREAEAQASTAVAAERERIASELEEIYCELPGRTAEKRLWRFYTELRGGSQ